MTETPQQAAMARVRMGSWMLIAGSLGAVLALLTWFDVWNVSDEKPTGWALVAAACFVLCLAGFAVLWTGLRAGALSERGGTRRPPGST